MQNLALHILDIVQNSISAEASFIKIMIEENIQEDSLKLVIDDNGRGMEKEFLMRVADPYTTTRTTRKVGMGLALLKQNAEQAGGGLQVSSETGKGTKVEAIFRHSHIDRPALGDIVGTIVLLAAGNPGCDFYYVHQKAGKSYIFDTREIKNILDDIPISDARIRMSIKELIHENLKEIHVL